MTRLGGPRLRRRDSVPLEDLHGLPARDAVASIVHTASVLTRAAIGPG